ncbi:MAG: DUF4369 domain-containing protein [Bacteroidaceae bacterium]|jgi:hypothetical protein|nr:DUF4369 domain-containing protein [Bacteroidaceae bacterium]
MKKFFISLILGAVTFASCSDQYLVSGSSDVEGLEGRMLYLRVFKENNMCAIDSSRVIHGRFKFRGVMDSVMMANVFLDDNSVMPVVLENGDVSVRIDESIQSATGTPLNDSLSSFIQKKSQIDARIAELPHLESQMIMNGIDHDQILLKLGQQARDLEMENDKLITRFIRSNYNNVLGPGVFMIMTSGFQYPILNPQIEEIISQAPPYFMNHPYVKEYIKAAESNMEKLRQY